MRRILVVDDDLHTRLAIRAWLERCGFRVAVADGGVNGVAALDNSAFDLMIVDILMPNMRGFESIRVFHQRAPTRCLHKPFRPATLLSMIDVCLSEAEPQRRHAASLAAVATARSEQQGATPP